MIQTKPVSRRAGLWRAPLVLLVALFSLMGSLRAAAASPGVDPQLVTATLDRGGSMVVAKTVHTPPIPPKPDIVLLSDTTGSMTSAIANVRTNANTIMSTVLAAQPDAHFAAAEYKDAAGCPDPFAYKLDQAMTANTAAVQSGINLWSASGGCDTPEQQLNALYTLATDPSVGFRPGSSRIIAWFGDSSGHDPSYGHTLSSVIAALQAAHIRVIAVPVNSGFGDGLDSTGQASAITSATGGVLLPAAAPGQVANAILAGLTNLPVTVTHAIGTCDPNLTITFDAASRTVTSGTDAHFAETIAVGAGAPLGGTLACQVNFLLDGNPAGPNFTQTIQITLPKHATTVTYGGDVTQDYNDPATLSATLRDASPSTPGPIAGRTVTFTLNPGPAQQVCSGMTDVAGHASCSITPNEPAAIYDVVASFAGDGQYLTSSDTKKFTVTLEETAIHLTVAPVLALAPDGTVQLSSVLKEDDATPIATRTVTLALGPRSCTAVTDVSGNAHCSVVPAALGPQTATATFAGDQFYRSSADSKPVLLFAYLARGSFVLGDRSTTAVPATWWGAQWAKLNSLSAGPAPDAFKGFAASATRPTCGINWTTGPGNSSNPPAASSIPSYMGVIVSSSIGKSGNTISGNVVKVVVVRTNPGYDSNPGHAGTGTVVATVCG